MNVYNQQHTYYCGIDLHARTMYICILDKAGTKVLHKNYPCSPEAFLEAVAPYRNDLVVTTECVFCWYWLADLCEQENIQFVLGHALYMKLIHGTKSKNDKNDSLKIARLLRGGNYPLAYVYPSGMRSTRDLMRRRCYFVRKRAQLIAHIQNTTSQYNLPPLGNLARPHHRRDRDIAGHFPDPVVGLYIPSDTCFEKWENILKERIFPWVNRPGCEARYNWKEPRVLSRSLDRPHHGNENFSMTASQSWSHSKSVLTEVEC